MIYHDNVETFVAQIAQAEQWTGMLPPEATSAWEVCEEVAWLLAFGAWLPAWLVFVTRCFRVFLVLSFEWHSVLKLQMSRYARYLALAQTWSFLGWFTTGSTSTNAKGQYGCGTSTKKVHSQAPITCVHTEMCSVAVHTLLDVDEPQELVEGITWVLGTLIFLPSYVQVYINIQSI